MTLNTTPLLIRCARVAGDASSLEKAKPRTPSGLEASAVEWRVANQCVLEERAGARLYVPSSDN